MGTMSIQKEVFGSVDLICNQITEAIKPAGFGVLTRIDFDQKMQEKLGEKIPRTAVLGACHPRLAYEAYQQTTDVTLLIPCNIVVRELRPGYVMIEAVRPTKMLAMLNLTALESSPLGKLASKVEADLEQVIRDFTGRS